MLKAHAHQRKPARATGEDAGRQPTAPPIATTTQALRLQRGRYLIQHLGIDGVAALSADQVYPFALLFAPDSGATGGVVRFIGTPDPNMVRLMTPGDRAAVDVGGERTLFFSVFNAPGAKAGIRLGVKRLGENRRERRSGTLEVSAHVQELGDQPCRDGWVGTRGSGRRLEGFRIAPPAPELGVELEYAAAPDDGALAWVAAGGFVGSRGLARPIRQCAARLNGRGAERLDIVYRGEFSRSGLSAVHRNGEPCRGKTEGDVLVALGIGLVAKGTRADRSLPVLPAVDRVEISDGLGAVDAARPQAGTARQSAGKCRAGRDPAPRPPRSRKR
jgi:hypothetical protein